MNVLVDHFFMIVHASAKSAIEVVRDVELRRFSEVQVLLFPAQGHKLHRTHLELVLGAIEVFLGTNEGPHSQMGCS
jgi:hypothetical protein